MNLTKQLKKELIVGLLLFMIPVLYIVTYSNAMLTDAKATIASIISNLVVLVIGFGRIYGINFKMKLDEREKTIVNKASGSAAFLLILIMFFIYGLRDVIIFNNHISINEFWGFFLVPVFLISHSLSGLILSSFE